MNTKHTNCIFCEEFGGVTRGGNTEQRGDVYFIDPDWGCIQVENGNILIWHLKGPLPADQAVKAQGFKINVVWGRNKHCSQMTQWLTSRHYVVILINWMQTLSLFYSPCGIKI